MFSSVNGATPLRGAVSTTLEEARKHPAPCQGGPECLGWRAVSQQPADNGMH